MFAFVILLLDAVATVHSGQAVDSTDRIRTTVQGKDTDTMTQPGDYGLPGSLNRVLTDVAAERAAQDAMWGLQEHPDGTGPAYASEADLAKRAVADSAAEGRLTWRHILHEEVLEAFAEDDPDRLRTELIQVAAVAVKWVQDLDRRATSPGRPETTTA